MANKPGNNILQWNCRGIFPNWEDLLHILHDNNILYACLQETLHGTRQVCPPAGYSIHLSKPRNGGCHGGTAILSQHGSPNQLINLQTSLDAVAIRATLPNITFSVCSLYLPPSEDIDIVALEQLIGQLSPPYLLLGDFNGRHPLWGDVISNRRGKIIQQFLQNSDLILLNSGKMTHFQLQTGTLSAIDLSLSSPNIFPYFQWSPMDDTLGSDHFPILLTHSISQPTTSRSRWSIKRADWILFARMISETITDNLEILSLTHSHISIDELIEDFTSQITLAAHASIPRSNSGTYKLPPIPWWNKACSVAQRKRKSANRRYRRTMSEIAKISYKRNVAIARRTYKEARRSSWQNYVSTLTVQSPMSAIWKRVRKLRKCYSPLSTPIIQNNGNFTANSNEIANIFSKQLTSLTDGSQYSQSFINIKQRKESVSLDFTSDNSEIYNMPLTPAEMYSALSKCKNTSPGPDDIHYEMLKHLPKSISMYMLYLFNLIWQQECFPESWRISHVLSFAKPGKDSSLPENYRPISLTSCLCKLLEKIINTRLMWYLEINKVLHPNQYGFRNMRSTIDPLIRLETAIKQAFAKKRHIIAIFFDIRKAYDTTWKYGVLLKMHHSGLRGHLPIFIKGFLANRLFRVRVGDVMSDWRSQEEGVPQGSVLSVTCFAIAINNIANGIPVGISDTLFVDDLSLYYSGSQITCMTRTMQLAVNCVERNASSIGFQFSPGKTVAMHFCRVRNCYTDPNLTMYNKPIPYVDTHKFLGLIFDRRLTWVPHLKAIKTSCIKSLDLLKVLSHCTWGADRRTLLKLYKSVILPKLMYGCQAYGSASITALRMLDSVHHSALRLITGAFRTSPIPSLYAESGIPSLAILRDMEYLQYYFRCVRQETNPISQELRDYIENPPELSYRSGIPFHARTFSLLEKYELLDKRTIPSKTPKIPPWNLPTVVSCSELNNLCKSTTSDVVIQNNFLSHSSECHSGSYAFYTDGSKNETSVGYAYVSSTDSQAGCLPVNASIYTAELAAILCVLKCITNLNDTNFTIYTDSRSTISGIKQYNSHHPIVLKIQQYLYLLHARQKKITFCWTPSHVGIPGNERADLLAKQCRSMNPNLHTPLPHTDYKPLIKMKLYNSWNDSWRCLQGNKLRRLKDSVYNWQSAFQRERWKEVLLTRLRIGHTRYTHEYLLCGEEPPICTSCFVNLTVEHLLVECYDFDYARRTCFSVDHADMRDLLTETDNFDPNPVLSFVEKTRLKVML